MGVCSVMGATAEHSHHESRAGFLNWKPSSPVSRTEPSHRTCQKYKPEASQNHLNKEPLHHTPVTICQSGSTAGSARTRPAGLITRQPPISHHGGQHGMVTGRVHPDCCKSDVSTHNCSCLSGITPHTIRQNTQETNMSTAVNGGLLGQTCYLSQNSTLNLRRSIYVSFSHVLADFHQNLLLLSPFR